MTAPTVLFDIDGTLLSFLGIGGRAMGRAMEEIWGISRPLEGVSFAGNTDSAVARQVGAGRDAAPMWRRYVELLAEAVRAHGPVPPFDGVAPLLDRLHARGARVGLLTGNLEASARIKLGAAGLLDRFDFAVSGFADHGVARAEIAAAARARCGDAPVTVVGDTPADVACARHIGARVLGVATGFASREDLLASRPDRLVDDLTATDDVADWLLARP